MAAETKKEIGLEIGHVLFIDIVGYSKLLNEEQKERLNQLTEIVLATTPVREQDEMFAYMMNIPRTREEMMTLLTRCKLAELKQDHEECARKDQGGKQARSRRTIPNGS